MLTPEDIVKNMFAKDELKKLLEIYGVENPEEFVASDAYNNGIEVECKVISITLLDDKCQTSLVKQGYPLR